MEPERRIQIDIATPRIVACGISDPGRIDIDNQDTIMIDAEGNFMLLADGMGGHERGAEASQTALDIIQSFLQPKLLAERLCDITEVEGVPSKIVCLYALVADAIDQANATLFERNQQANLSRYMGTTVVGLIRVNTDHMLWFHVGDSRLYRWRAPDLKCLTTDHSVFSQWMENGQQGPEPEKNIITRAIGPLTSTSSDIAYDQQKPSDVYLLCSDGLTEMLADADIIQTISKNQDVSVIADGLIRAAKAAGGKDDISVVVCKLLK
jgi:protein phosphatase